MTTLPVQWKHYPKTGNDERKKSFQRKPRAILEKHSRMFRQAQARLQKLEHESPEWLIDVQAETPPALDVPVGLGTLTFGESYPGGRMLRFQRHGERVDEVKVLDRAREIALEPELRVALVLFFDACRTSAVNVMFDKAKVFQSWIGTRLPTESDWELASGSDLAFFDNTLAGHEVSHVWRSIADLLWTRTRTGFNQSQLTDPEQLLDALDAQPPKLTTLILFAESLPFEADQQTRLLPHLVAFVKATRTTTDSDELVALGSAIRKLIAYLPFSEFDSLSDLLGSGATVVKEAELELAKGIVYRLSWDEARPECPRLCDDLFDLGMFHSSKRVVDSSSSAAIALNATIALALLGDHRVRDVVATLSRRSLAWFLSLVKTRVRRLVTKWQKDKRSPDTLGLLPDLLDSFQ